jgi:hypothetical protein
MRIEQNAIPFEANHSFSSTSLGSDTILENDPLTRDALAYGSVAYKGFGPFFFPGTNLLKKLIVEVVVIRNRWISFTR